MTYTQEDIKQMEAIVSELNNQLATYRTAKYGDEFFGASKNSADFINWVNERMSALQANLDWAKQHLEKMKESM